MFISCHAVIIIVILNSFDTLWVINYNLTVVVYKFLCFLLGWTPYKLLVIGIIHDCFNFMDDLSPASSLLSVH